MKIFDCFIFFNENLLTEIRLNILYKFVDFFVICEAQEDHRGNFKGYNFDHSRFEKFKDKIIYIQLDKFPKNLGAWERQDFQRNYLKEALISSEVGMNDLIIYSDADEIINPNSLENFQNIDNNIIICEQYCFYYKLNLLSKEYYNLWEGSRMVFFKNLKSFSWLRGITKKNLKYKFYRFDKFKKIKILKNSGWHFSYLMNEIEIQKKIKSWTHAEFDKKNFTSLENIRKKIENNQDLFDRGISFSKVSFDCDIFPKYLIDNRDLYESWII